MTKHFWIGVTIGAWVVVALALISVIWSDHILLQHVTEFLSQIHT